MSYTFTIIIVTLVALILPAILIMLLIPMIPNIANSFLLLDTSEETTWRWVKTCGKLCIIYFLLLTPFLSYKNAHYKDELIHKNPYYEQVAAEKGDYNKTRKAFLAEHKLGRTWKALIINNQGKRDQRKYKENKERLEKFTARVDIKTNDLAYEFYKDYKKNYDKSLKKIEKNKDKVDWAEQYLKEIGPTPSIKFLRNFVDIIII